MGCIIIWVVLSYGLYYVPNNDNKKPLQFISPWSDIDWGRLEGSHTCSIQPDAGQLLLPRTASLPLVVQLHVHAAKGKRQTNIDLDL